ncbi:serine carboxypeptidase-like 25 [Arachis stenosperma]|uniref:serine carboxypeptidase-like 25 n=1 Tax=Arachis stenosperma TaxID=217475 RepID=UPI0025AD199F|nr:serine carboxypeptidase-like 25 [Arachis stenosperma]
MDEQHHKKIFVVLHQVVVILLVMVVPVGPSSCVKGGEEEDRILELPGQPKVSFQQFSAYVTVNKVAGRALFYCLTESSQNSLRKPLVIWLNGGSTCSTCDLLVEPVT